MNKDIELTRKEIGNYLSNLRQQKKLSKYQIGKRTSLRINVINSIEESSSAYTFDSLLKYASGLNLKLYFEEEKPESELSEKKTLDKK